MERYMFFYSVDGEDERYYTADEFADYFRQVISSGILNGGTNLQVVCSGTDMQVQINQGYAWLEGYLYKIDTKPLALTLDTADPSLDRIDRVVIRLDKTLENRYVRAFVLKGEPAGIPVAPTITRDENIFELSLAQIKVIGGKSYVEGGEITDERLNTEVCGLANSLVTADTTDIFNQFQDWFNSKTAEPGGEFYKEWKEWFESVVGASYLTHTQADALYAPNLGIASQPEAEGGVVSNKYMTPERTKQAITILSPPSGKKVFNSNGTFTVPVGVTEIFITACGGGGGGGSGANTSTTGSDGDSGGSTIISDLVTLPGGSGGKGAQNWINGEGAGGSKGGIGGSDGNPGNTGSGTITAINFPGSGGAGGSSLGAGGAGGKRDDYGCTGSYGGGGGGGGGGTASNGSGGGGGGGGACIIKQKYTVTPNQVINITVGTWGNRGAYGNLGGSGGAGIVIIEW